MNKRRTVIAVLAVCACLLSGCSGFEKEYVSVHDYVPSEQELSVSGGRLSPASCASRAQTATILMRCAGLFE